MAQGILTQGLLGSIPEVIQGFRLNLLQQIGGVPVVLIKDGHRLHSSVTVICLTLFSRNRERNASRITFFV